MPEDPDPPDSLAPEDVEQLELFRRSPHPYHRRAHELRSNDASQSSDSADFTRTALSPNDRTISDEDDRKRRKQTPSPSESGTEADDEGYGFIKALPAPPLRPRKGLRDTRGSGLDSTAPSPLLTPSLVDEEGSKFSAEYFKPRRGKDRTGEPSPTDDEAKAARQKYLKRRRSELVRRTTETALLGFIGLLAVRGCGCWNGLLIWNRGLHFHVSEWYGDLSNMFLVELSAHVFTMAFVLALYPLRLLYYSKRRVPPSNLRPRQRIRIPAAFDPAPILYPTILPVLIAISLYPSLPNILFPNILLGLAAIPTQLIPYGSTGFGFSSAHWVLSTVPLFASEHTDFAGKLLAKTPYKLKLPPKPQGYGLSPETLVSLFALHHALLPPLQYLTTTSLLPAELHLLSIGLINLVLFTESSQAEILKTLLWLGGVGLFVLTGKVLKWGVALARIPRWRFRRAGQIIKARQSFLQVLNESLRPRSQSAQRAIDDSDADEDDPIIKNPLTKTKKKLNMLPSLKMGIANDNTEETKSAVDADRPALSSAINKALASVKRRNTLPSLPSQTPNDTRSTHTHKRGKSIAQSYLSLTPSQAALRKWIYAFYFYFVVAAMILGPIRYQIGKHALNGYEPFGWALGYLFGNLQSFRFEVFNWDLEWWIALPPMFDLDIIPSSVTLGRAEYLRQVVIGEANTRLLLCLYCAGIIVVGLIVVLSLSSIVEVDTRRKVFHGMMVAMLLPTIFIDPAFVALALALVLSIFLLLDLIRASQLPPLSKPIAKFLTPYVDGRDLRGPVVVSHIFLLIGCAIPLWLSLAGLERGGEDPWKGWEVQNRDISMIAGVVCVGMGDAAASLIGRRYGRRKWPWAGGKSLEGSLAFAIAVTIGLVFGKVWLRLGQWEAGGFGSILEWPVVIGKAALCAAGASLNEAVLTGGNDNVVVPVVLWVLVRGVNL
jgi:dolichol kinase